MKTKRQLTYTLLIIFGIIILINIVSLSLYKRFDTTQNKDYTMSNATNSILKGLEEPVTITAYFSKGLPPQFAKVKSDLKSVVEEYASISKGKVAFEFIDPTESPEMEKRAVEAGIRPVMINVRQKDKMEQQKAYIGVVIKYRDKTEAIPVIQEGSAIEYILTTSIKKLTITNKPLIGFIQGHGEPTINAFGQSLGEMSVLYDIKPVTLGDTTDINRFKTLVITAPTKEYSEYELDRLESYLAAGGKLMINIEHVKADLQNSMEVSATNVGIEGWLTKYGLVIEDNAVIDKKCGTIGVVQNQGSFSMRIPMAFPYLPIISNFADHPITEKLHGLITLFPASIQYTGNGSDKTFTPLLFTSEASGTQALPLTIQIDKKWLNSDYPLKGVIIGGVLTGSFDGGPETSIVVIADGDYILPQGQQRVNADNINLFANSIDWLSDDTGLMDLRSKGISYRPIDEMEDGRKAFLKWFNFLFPIVVVVIYGLINMQLKHRKRIKRMEEYYVK
ncbi:MAG: GldG family protein [Bacteroidales bacterium]|nr:GldG family protein [Bacteroidales bacterium]